MADGADDGSGGDDDTRLLVASRTDLGAFEQFYRRNWDRILAYLYRRTLCPNTANDLAAETFARAFESRHRFRAEGGNGVAWTFGIASNLYRDWLRRAVVGDRARRRFRIQTPQLVEEDLERIEQLLDLDEYRRSVREGLDTLTPKLREAVLLRVVDDLPYEHVARHLGCSVGAARVRVSRGLDQLLAHLEPT